MIIRHRQQIASRAASIPLPLAWHFGSAGYGKIVRYLAVRAVLAARDVPAERAVRQFSIADITLSWPRLIWPALARRHVGRGHGRFRDSSDGRDTTRVRRAVRRPP